MKLGWIFGFASSATASIRTRRSMQSVYSMTGEEDIQFLDNLLANVTLNTIDEIELEIARNSPFMRRETDIEMRKFRNLKVLVLWLQKEKLFGRYCYYGCHCLPEGSHNIAQGGYGKPHDNIDASCRRFGQCYKCLVDEHKDDGLDINGADGCIGEEIGYRYDLMHDNATGKNSIECTNKIGSCRRNICECDKQLAENLALYEDQWNEQFHANRGGFERLDECERPSGGGSNKFEECCGDKTTFPFNTPRKTNQCCDGAQALRQAPDQNGKCY